MKLGSVLTCLVGSVVLLSAAATDPKVTFIPHDKVAKGGTARRSTGSDGADQPPC